MLPERLSHQPSSPSPGNDHDEVKLGQEIELDPSRLLSDEEMEEEKDDLSGKRGDTETKLMSEGQSLSHEAPMEITLQVDQEQHVDEMELVEVGKRGDTEIKLMPGGESLSHEAPMEITLQDDQEQHADEMELVRVDSEQEDDDDENEDDNGYDDKDEDYYDNEDEEDDDDIDIDEDEDDDDDEEYEVEDEDEDEDDDDDDEDDDDDGGGGEENEYENDDRNNDKYENDYKNKEGKRTVTLHMSNLKELKCPICLGIMRKTKAVMECMHRFCGECIEKAMRLSKHECPVCRVHIPSRRSLRDDFNIDNIIAVIFSDTNKPKKKKGSAIMDAGEITDKNEEAVPMDEGTEDENIVHVGSEISLSPYDHSITQVGRENGSSSRLARFIDHLRNSDVNDDQFEIPLALVSLDEQKIPSLHEPYLYCRPTCSVKILCKYVALKAELLADQVEFSLVEESQTNVMRGELTVDPDKDKLHVLRDDETLADLYKRNVTNCRHLLLAYKMK